MRAPRHILCISEVGEIQVSAGLACFFLSSTFWQVLAQMRMMFDRHLYLGFQVHSHFPLRQRSLGAQVWTTSSDRIKVLIFSRVNNQNCFTCRTVSAFANSTTECVIKWRDNSSHLLFYTKEKTLKSWYTLNRTFGTPNNGRFFVLRSTCLLFSKSKQHFWK